LIQLNLICFFLSIKKGNNTSPRQNTSGRRPQQRTGSSGQSTSTTTRGGNGEPLKFEGEFDFEQANARFEQEIEKEFSDKLKITSSSKQQNNQREHTNDTSLTNSQSMTLQDIQDQQHIIMKQKSLHSGSDSLEKPQSKPDHDQHSNLHNRSSMDEDQKNFYDKNISFFDRISCESNEKTQSKPKNWKEERKINAETFGLQQRQQNEMKQNYSRPYSNNYGNNYRNTNTNNYQSSQNNGRSYPRNNYLNNSNNNQQQMSQQQQYRNTNNNANNKNSSQRYNGQRSTNGNNQMRTGSGYTNSNNYRRNEVEVNSSRRFGSR
jgi:protein LSM14